MKRTAFIIMPACLALALVWQVGYAQKQKEAAAAPGNVAAITAAQLQDYLYFIASDEMEGRDTPSRGLDLTAKFLALNLSRWGIKPGAEENSYFQKFPLRRRAADSEKSKAELNGQALSYGDDFIAQASEGKASGNLVFAGHGWVVKAKGINAYKTATGELDVKDKIVVVYSGAVPKGINFRELRRSNGDDTMNPGTYALRHGAKGLLLIPSKAQLGAWARSVENSTQLSRWQFGPEEEKQLPSIMVSEKVISSLFAGETLDGEAILKKIDKADFDDAFAFTADKKVSFSVSAKEETTTTQNVVGILEGSDPVMKNEYVAIGAHYDHVGTRTTGSGDRIFNGADDDGSGTTAVLAIAEALAKGPRPKRSVIFVWHCGEEKGLWGSDYFTDHPTVPLTQIITQLNIDMIGRSKTVANMNNPRNKELSAPDEIYVIGSKMMSTDLGNLSEAVNKSYLKLSFNYKYDDPNDPNRFFFRSDHFNYARKGVPIIFYFDGVHEDYHQPSDHPDKIDYRKMEKVTRTIFATAWELANGAKRPVVDKQLPAALAGN